MANADATRACVVCGALFPRNGKQTLCSDACKAERSRSLHATQRAALAPVLACAHCAKEFTARNGRRYCCMKCKDARRRSDPNSADAVREHRRKWAASERGKAWRSANYAQEYKARKATGKPRDRAFEYESRRARLGIVRRAKDLVALALRSVAVICALSGKKERAIRTHIRHADDRTAKTVSGLSKYTLNLRARPEAYITCLARWRAKSFKRKTGRVMPQDGTVGTSCLKAKACIYCNAKLNDSNRTIDHMVPLVLGGIHSAANVAPCCKQCNSSKAGEDFHSYVMRLPATDKARAIRFFERLNGPLQQIGLMLAV